MAQQIRRNHSGQRATTNSGNGSYSVGPYYLPICSLQPAFSQKNAWLSAMWCCFSITKLGPKYLHHLCHPPGSSKDGWKWFEYTGWRSFWRNLPDLASKISQPLVVYNLPSSSNFWTIWGIARTVSHGWLNFPVFFQMYWFLSTLLSTVVVMT